MKSSLKISYNKLYLCIPTFILTFLSSNVVYGANAWLWEDSDGNENMSWTGDGTVSGGDTNGNDIGDINDADYLISGTSGGTFQINQIGGYHQGTGAQYALNPQPFDLGATMEIIVNGGPLAQVDFTVDLVRATGGLYVYRSIFDIAPNAFVTSVEINTLFGGERVATTPDGGGNFQSFALSWANAATIGEVMTVDTKMTGISINGGNLSNPTVGGNTFSTTRTAATATPNITGNTYSIELDGNLSGNNHGIWSLQDATTNGTFRGQNVTFTPEDGLFDEGGYFRYTFDGATLNAAPIPEPSSAILIGLGGLAFILRRRR